MKRLLLISALALLALVLSAGPAQASSGNLKGFGTGTVTIGADGASATIVNASGQFGGVYQQSKDESGLALVDVHISFVSTGFETGGAPRFSIPINTSGPSGGDGSVAGYAFIDAPGCGGTSGSTTTVSTSASCHVNFLSKDYLGGWPEFVAAFPNGRIAQGHFIFIIADEAGNYAINSINLG